MKNSILEKARWLRDVALATSKNNGARVAREWLKYAAMFVMLFTIGSGNVWGAVESGTTYETKSSMPTGWSKNGEYNSSSYLKLISSSNYILTDEFCQGKITTIIVKARTFGRPSATQKVITAEWVETGGKTTTLGTVSPSSTTLANCTITVSAATSTAIANTQGKIKISCKKASSSKGSGVSAVTINYNTGSCGGGSCSECTYYVYNGSTWVDIGTTGFNDVVLAPPTLPDNGHGAGNGCWVKDKTFFDGGCTSNINNNNNDYRFVPNPGGEAPDAENKPGSGTCELYAVYAETNGCLSTRVTAVACARIWDEPDNLAVSSVSSTGATLSWDAIDGVSSYHVIVTKVSNSSIVFDGNVNGTSKSLTGLTSGTEYSWKVAANSATNDACDSNFSNVDNFTTCASGFTSLTPTVTADKTGKNGGEALFELSGATSYSVTLKNNSTNAVIAGYNNVSNTSGNITFSGLTASTTYRVEVIAHNACGDNSQTGSETFTTDAATLYTVTFHNAAGDAPSAVTQKTEGGTVDIPSAEACDGWTFAGWKIGGAQSSTTSDPTGSGYITSASYTPEENIDAYAVFSKTEGGGSPVNDVLNQTWTNVTGTSYSTLSDKTAPSSTAVYSVNCAGGNSSIQLRSDKSTSGVVMTASGGNVTKVTVEWNNSTSSGRTLDIYGKNSAYTAATDLYNASTQGKKLGSIVCGTSTELTINDDYAYIGFRSLSGAMYLTSVTITIGGGGTTTWRSDPPCRSEYTVTYNAGDATSGTAPIDPNSPYAAGSQVTILGNTGNLAKTDKVFGGWSLTLGGSKAYDAGGTIASLTGNVTLYPYWVNPPYTVTFNAEGGTCGTTSLTEASGGAGVILPAATATCAPAGWSFYGWATSTVSSTTIAPATFVGATGETYYPESDITLHAVYVNSGTYNSNPVCHEVTIGSHTNGTINVNSSTTSPQTVTQGATVNIAATPESGYRFTGWTIKKTTGGNDVTSTLLGANATTASTSFTMPDNDVTVEAVFVEIINYTITWKVNNANYTTYTGPGTLSTSAEGGVKWSTLTLPDAPADNTLSACERTKFVGWSISQLTGDGHSAPSDLFKTTSDANADSHTITGNTTFYAVFAKGGGDGSWVVNGNNLDQTDPQNASPYGKYNGEHTLDGITFNTSDVCTNNGNLQFKASAGTLYNKTAMPADITSIELSVNTLKVYQNSSVTSSPGALAAITPTGTGPYTYTFTSGNRYFLIKEPDNGASYSTVTVNYEGTGTDYVTSCACSWQINYITNGKKNGDGSATWSTDNCFQKVGDTHEWQIENFAMPNVAGQFWVGPGYFKAPGDWGHSVIADLSTVKYVRRSDKVRTDYSAVSNMIGTLNVWDNGEDDNYHVGIYPDYQITYGVEGGGESWTKVDFNYISGTTYETEVVTAPTYFAVEKFKYYVGVKTDGNTGWGGKSSTVMMNTMSGMTTNQNGKNGKWRMYEDSGDANWYCAWVPYYVLSYDANDGTGAPSAEAPVSSEGDAASRTKVVSATVPTRDGYTFVGWNTAADGSGTDKAAGDNVVLTSDVVLYAQWRQNFTVTYDRVGGTDVCANETCGAGITYTVCGTEPTKSGYIFSGWKDASTSVVYNAGDNFTMPAADVTLTAQWTANWRNLTFNVPAGGGSITGGPSGNHVLDNRTFTFPNITGKSDAKWCWTFLGWTETAPNGSGTWATTPSYIAGGATSGAITSDKTYYAVYSKTGAGASGDVECDAAAITAIGTGGGHAYADEEWTIVAADQSSWKARAYVGNNGTFLQIKEDAEIYIKLPTVGGNYTSITLNHNSNSSSRTIVYRTDKNGDIVASHTTGAHETSSTIDISGGSTTGYIMMTGSYTYQITSITAHFGPPAVYGHTLDDCGCQVTQFNLTYNANSTTFPGSTISCSDEVDYVFASHDDEYTFCSAPTPPTGYRFLYWAENANGTGNHWEAGETVSCLPSADLTVYAFYERVYTVTFNNEGSITPVTQASAGASVAVPDATSPCSGEWAFVGWSETEIAPMSFLPTLEITAGEGTYTPTADKTLYAIYRKTSESSPFVAGMSGAYKIKATVSATDYYAGAINGAKLNQETTVGNAVTYYIKYTSVDGGKYTIQRADGKYIAYKGNQPTGASTDIKISDDAFYWRISSAGGGLWAIQSPTSTDANTRYLQLSVGTGFKAYTTDVNPTFVAAEGEYYYRTMSCEDEFDITFHNNGTTINWAGGYPEAAYKGLADATVISTFPTATFDGWTFIGWRQADYKESTDAPASSSVFGGSNGTSGNKLTIASANVDLYPVFTRFEDNEPFDQINGGDYYIYFLESGSDDGYGAEKRVYAASYSDNKRYNSTSVCSGATEFTFTKLDNGNWTIYDKTTGKYLYATGDDWLRQQASATGAEWTLTVNGNQFDAFRVGTEYGQITAFGNGESATFMNYRRTNIGSIASYHRVYLGGCTNRTFTTNPSTTPNIEIHGQVKVTSTANKSIKAASVLTVSASNIATANLTVTSDNPAFTFSLASNGAYTASVNIPVVSNKVGVTPIYVEYTPSATEDGIEEATITVSDGASPTPTTATTNTGDVQGRHVPANFVIAAKWGNKWYALPANCTESTSSTTGVLIEVDNASDPTRATAAPSYTKWGLQTVRQSRKANYGTRLVFTEQLTTATADDQKTLYNGSTTSIQANAMYKNYMGDATEKYEWIPTTTDLKDYVLTSATTLSGDASARTVSLSNKGVFGTLLINKSNDGKVRILPANFYEPVEMQVIEWKANSLVVMYGGAGIKATTQVGNNDPGDLQTLASAKVDHGVYELTTSQALTSSTNMPLTITVKNESDVTTGTCALIVPAIVTGNQDAPLGLEADEATLTDVVVTDGATLSAVATKYTFKNITVYPGGKLVIGSGKQLGMASLTLRGGSSWGAATYEHKYPQFVVNNTTSGAYSNSSAVINYDYVTTKDQYYSFVLPYDGSTGAIKYPVDIYGRALESGSQASFEFQYYDGAARAAGGTGWKVLAEPATLVAGTGYTFLGMPRKVDAYDGTDDSHANTRQRYGIHRIPMSVAAATVQAGETNSAPGKATPIRVTLASKNNNSGWALVGNPYLSNVSGLSNTDIQVGKLVHTDTNPWDGKWQWDDTNSNTGVRYIVTTDDGQNFESQQASTATLKAFKNFFVQIQNGDATSLVIPANSRTDKDLAPARYMADVEQDIQLAVDLVSETRSDKVDLLINDVYTAEFDQDGDFTKMMNTTNFNLYGVYPEDYLSFIAVDKTTAAGSIAIGYQVPAAGEYTLQLSERPYVMSDYVETLLVTDHEVSPEVTTDLLENPYSFTVTKAETNDARFTVSIKLKENQDTPTDIDIINGGGDLDGEKPIKFIYHDKMYILRNGVLYDATGKKVK